MHTPEFRTQGLVYIHNQNIAHRWVERPIRRLLLIAKCVAIVQPKIL